MAKKSSRDVFDLIKSLSRSEKRYFRLTASRLTPERDNKYEQLFSLLDGFSDYDEQRISTAAGAIGIKDLPGLKQYLYELLLRCLREFRQGNTTTARLRSNLWNVETLFFKGLHKQCRKLLNRTRKLAETSEYFTALIQVLTWETRLTNHYPETPDVRAENRRLHLATTEAVRKLRNATEMDYLANDMYILELHMADTRRESDVKALEELIQQPLLRDERNALSRTALVDYYDVYMRYHRIQGNARRSLDFARKKLEIFSMNNAYTANRPYQYAFAVTHYLTECIKQRYFYDYELYLEQLRSFKKVQKEFAAVIEESIYTAELDKSIVLADLPKGETIAGEAQRWLEANKSKMELSSQVEFYFRFCHFALLAGKLDEALHWSNILLNHSALPAMPHLEGNVRLLDLIIHFELNNTQLLESRIRSAYRFLTSRQRLYRYESRMLKFIRQVPLLYDAMALKTALAELRNDILLLREDHFESRALEKFDLLSWLEAKIENLPFHTVVRGKAGQAG